MKKKKMRLKEAAGVSNHQRAKRELADLERRKDFAACAMIEAASMVKHWQRKTEEAKSEFNACLVQLVLHKYNKTSVEQMIADGFSVKLS